MLRCKPEEIILHGEISGLVTDTTTSQPLQAVPVKLNPINDTTSTGIDGKYLFKSLIPGDYKIEVSKLPYAKSVRKAAVTSANTTEINFALHKISYPEVSARYVDFGFDSTLKSFTITNQGTGKLKYFLTANQDWITVYPASGESTTETDTIKVTINRAGLSEKKHIESIEIDSYIGQDIVRDTIYVLLNGVMDQDFNYYDIVTIGTQTWMAENLNTGVSISFPYNQEDNGKIEKWCNNCKTYGGLYQWYEMMQYKPGDSATIGITQGICPVGWHIPTNDEWETLFNYIGKNGGKLKESGTVHWASPNSGATNEYGFTALPSGVYEIWVPWEGIPLGNNLIERGTVFFVWSANFNPPAASEGRTWESGYVQMISYDQEVILKNWLPVFWGASVRCIKDPPKNK
jgi:uncharacterized protein (TIGR02145 family)